MDLDVVRMAVSPIGVVRRHHLWALAPDHPHCPSDRLHEVGLPKALRVVVVGRAHHPRVAVAEKLGRSDAQNGQCLAELLLTDLPQTITDGIGIISVMDRAHLTARPGDHRHVLAGSGVARQRSSHREALVIGVGVERQ